MTIEIDIIDKIFEDFKGENLSKAYLLIKSRMEPNYPITFSQYPRSILFLAKGNLSKLQELIKIEDPRDIVCDAEELSGNTGHWFSISFSEIEKLNGSKYIMPLDKKNGHDSNTTNNNLPF